ncbi:MAG: RNA-directed DNA polymerase [Clostridia bacterium]|nr:RNA-directed DNA polymerase [Clostridia bacterium]
MGEILKFEELYNAYLLCLKNKKRKTGTFNFVNSNLSQNLISLLDSLNNRTYKPLASNCYVITEPALREIYAAQFRDRVVQHFYMKEIEEILDKKLVDGCCSCRKGKGTDYALSLLKNYLVETSNNGKKDCYFLKIDLSGYFMSIDRKQISDKFEKLIIQEYTGKHKGLLLYLTPIIFENNPAQNCKYKCNEDVRNKVPERRKMNPKSEYGMAIGNLTAQAASNLNLNDFDNYIVKELKLEQYVRYVDDAIIICENKEKLKNAIPKIKKKLKETHQILNEKKTKIDTAYHGVKFLGKISYPYGYQKSSKDVNIRLNYKAKNIKFNSKENLLAKVNSQIGTFKNYNCRKVILNYEKNLNKSAKDKLVLDKIELKFKNII